MCGPAEEGMVKDGDSTGHGWDPARVAAALCCRVPVWSRPWAGSWRVLRAGAAGVGAGEGPVPCFCCGKGLLAAGTAASPR